MRFGSAWNESVGESKGTKWDARRPTPERKEGKSTFRKGLKGKDQEPWPRRWPRDVTRAPGPVTETLRDGLHPACLSPPFTVSLDLTLPSFAQPFFKVGTFPSFENSFFPSGCSNLYGRGRFMTFEGFWRIPRASTLRQILRDYLSRESKRLNVKIFSYLLLRWWPRKIEHWIPIFGIPYGLSSWLFLGVCRDVTLTFFPLSLLTFRVFTSKSLYSAWEFIPFLWCREPP